MKRKIMVVDDDISNYEAVKLGLEGVDPDYEVICADSGDQCLELLENNQIPDLILLDIMMPEMSGWQLFDKLRRNPSWEHIPIIFLTARTDRIAKETGSFFGEDYIEKPYEIEDLKNRIEKILKEF